MLIFMYRIKFKFGLGIEFGTLISKIWIKCQGFDKKGIIPLILVQYSLNRWSPWQQGNLYTQTLSLKDGLYMYD